MITNSWPEEREVKLKLNNGTFKKIDHINDLVILFPDYAFGTVSSRAPQT